MTQDVPDDTVGAETEAEAQAQAQAAQTVRRLRDFSNRELPDIMTIFADADELDAAALRGDAVIIDTGGKSHCLDGPALNARADHERRRANGALPLLQSVQLQRIVLALEELGPVLRAFGDTLVGLCTAMSPTVETLARASNAEIAAEMCNRIDDGRMR